ncbi:Ti-type conjugative transfer relaxase TraA [Roseibium sp. HPY-6]|uniref:Ti-type conjugative transfer relaxase TraA n=1 Tax=Roseibium sp. HPY-6 TaxID=3229852 RepID=UPI00338F8412
MILVGNQRGNSKDMANHLLKADNEKVIIHELRGFLGNDLHTAFQESYAISRATDCKQHLYSLSLNPPKGADVDAAQFEETIERAEKRLGLTGQPRAIVFHHKRGRDGEMRVHAHAVWCRIDTDKMKAIHHSYDHKKLEKLSLEIFQQNGWEIPRGFFNKAERDPLNYTHAEHQQARRRNKYADDIKRSFQSAWVASDSKEAFAAALKDQGYILARGDRRDFVAVDANGEVYSIARATGIYTKDLRAKLGEAEGLPFVGQATQLAEQLPRQQSISQDAAQQPQNSRIESPIERQVRHDPEHILSMMTERESVFSRHDIAKALNTYIHDPDEYQAAYQKVMTCEELKPLNADPSTPDKDIRFSTSNIIRVEKDLMQNARQMAARSTHKIPDIKVEAAIWNHDAALKNEIGVGLSAEQKRAIQHMTDDRQLSCVVGAAGTGKSTILAAAREAWEASGHRVFGAALAGKAAKGLEQCSGIQSRTLASFELSWENDRNQLQRGDVLVIDEAGMIGSKQMSRFINEAKDKGVKVVLVGDAEQLQPIEAGAPFRVMTERLDKAELQNVHRQRQDWQKSASQSFALGKTQAAINAYQENNRIEFAESQDEAVQGLVADYLNDYWSSNSKPSQLALAHRKKDVKAINETIREARKEAGELQDNITFQTSHGRREFASGDRLLFTRNDREVGVQNGMLGTVIQTNDDSLTIELDDKAEDGTPNLLTISASKYNDIEHGYATTIHKSQGATVDRSYVLASHTMDRHLTYVAMTRHKYETKLYASNEEIGNFDRLISKLSRARPKQSTLDLTQPVSLDREQNNQVPLTKHFRKSAENSMPDFEHFNRDWDNTPEI